jgi:hypothetical protein
MTVLFAFPQRTGGNNVGVGLPRYAVTSVPNSRVVESDAGQVIVDITVDVERLETAPD